MEFLEKSLVEYPVHIRGGNPDGIPCGISGGFPREISYETLEEILVEC